MNTKLQMDFLNQGGKKFQISLDNPREGLTGSEVAGAMDDIIQNNVFTAGMLDLSEAKSARIVTTEIEELEI